MPVRVGGAHADDGCRGPDGVEQQVTCRKVRPVVPHFEHVHRTDQRALTQYRLDWRLRVAGEESGEAAESKDHHHRRVVDVVAGKRRATIGVGRVEHLECRAWIEVEALAGSRQHEAAPRF